MAQAFRQFCGAVQGADRNGDRGFAGVVQLSFGYRKSEVAGIFYQLPVRLIAPVSQQLKRPPERRPSVPA
jgi:hypothetical protein